MTSMTGACDECVLRPCPTCAAARAVLGAWSRERRYQLGEDCYRMGIAVPDRAAMKAAIDKALEPHRGKTCECECHSKTKANIL